MYYIYRTTNLINGKTYIGQHETSDMLNDSYIGSGKLIKRAFQKGHVPWNKGKKVKITNK